MAQGVLDSLADRNFSKTNLEDANIVYMNAIEMAICSLSKCPAATDRLLGKLVEAINDADSAVRDTYHEQDDANHEN